MRKDNFMLKDAKRIVVKVGTSCLTHENGKTNIKRIEKLVRVLSDLMNTGKQIVLVSSGAIGVGVGRLGLDEKPSETRFKQALAAIGQSSLMSIYDKFFGEYGYITAQVLLTKYVLDNGERYENSRNAFNTMFEYGVIPIVNENDVISTHEIEFGDNDRLSAYVSKLIDADLLVLMSDVDGFYDKDPSEDGAKIIPVIEKIDERIYSLAGGAGSNRGTGGMKTKLMAGEIVNDAGIDMVLINGKNPDNLYGIFENDYVGTLFLGKE